MPAKTIDEFIATHPAETQAILTKIRGLIHRAAPGADEAMAYGIPTFRLNGRNLVHFSAFKSHVGFYPTPSGIAAFRKELSVYEGGKGSVKFPLDGPIPWALITKIVKFRVQEERAQTPAKKKSARPGR